MASPFPSLVASVCWHILLAYSSCISASPRAFSHVDTQTIRNNFQTSTMRITNQHPGRTSIASRPETEPRLISCRRIDGVVVEDGVSCIWRSKSITRSLAGNTFLYFPWNWKTFPIVMQETTERTSSSEKNINITLKILERISFRQICIE